MNDAALTNPINMGVFSGIIIGIISAKIYLRFYKTKLNPVLGFFEGKRLVPIVMVIVSIILGVVLGFVWPPIQNGINYLGQLAIDARIGQFRLGGAIYAFGNRALIPTGLHHVFKTPFTTQFGSYVAKDGQTYVGEIARFFAGDPTAGAITAAEYPLKIFGLPAAVAKGETIMTSPMKGKLISITEVPDPLFAEKMVGDGFAIEPYEGYLVSPVSGTIAHIFETNHALAIITDNGLEVLIHIGIDTVKMEGRGFKRLAEIGDHVVNDTPLMEFDLELAKKEAKSSITEVVVTNMDIVKGMEVIASGDVGILTEVLKVK